MQAIARKAGAGEKLALWAAGILFVGLRIAGLLKQNELEDEDSTGILYAAEALQSLDFQAILDIGTDVHLFYPALIALLSPLTGDLELAGRIVSIAASASIAVAVYLTARRFVAPWAGIVAVLFMAVNPYFIRFSYSVVSEPVYCAIFAWALYVFVTQFRAPNLRSWLILGILAGLGFSSRFESILLFACLPAMQAVYLLVQRRGSREWYGAMQAGLVYALVFLFIVAPQVWRLSEKMGSFNLSGRFAWQLVMDEDSDRSYPEKLYSLDFDPGTINILYVRESPEARQQLAQNTPVSQSIAKYLVRVIINLRVLHETRLVLLVGLPVCIFAVIGFIALLRSSQALEGAIAGAFVLIGLVAPLAYRVDLDHIALIVAPISTLAGIGLYDTVISLTRAGSLRLAPPAVVAIAALAFALAPYPLGLAMLYKNADDANKWYDLASVQEPVAAIRELSREADDKSGVVASKAYVPLYAGRHAFAAPWTDLPGLLTFMELNGIYLLHYDEDTARRPFGEAVDTDRWNAAFTLYYDGRDSAGERQAIYIMKDRAASRPATR